MPRLCRQQPIRRMFNKTSTVPEAIPIKSSKPEALVMDGEFVVGGPPNDDAGCDGGGVSILDFVVRLKVGN